MDETSSSSSAAVADSASAAASSKTTAAAVSTATSVNLLIKASNQQFDDQIIESDLLWTVKRLKTQLSLVYPSKPPVAEQKLIYSGQLLNDTLQLKDVLRSYKDVYTHNHIFHLVYTPKNAPPPNLTQKPKIASPLASNMSTNTNVTTDGLRQRHGGGVQQQQQQQQAQFPQYATHPQLYPQMMAGAGACPPYDPNNPHNTMPFSFPGQFNMQAMATQQVAMYNWMQQVYSQYMDQCVRLSNTPGIQNMSPPNNASTLGHTLPPNLFLQQMPFMSPNAGVATNPVIPFPSATATAAAATLVAQPQAATSDVQPVDNQQEQQQVAAAPPQQLPRFPNIVQDEQDNRDWLDSFFSITRLAIFLTILYFNSSPLRCLVVVIIAGGIYLYHIGVFRLRHERNNNNINRNNNAAADQIRQGVQAAQQQQENPPNPIIAAAEAEAEHGNGGPDAEPLVLPSATPNVGAADEVPVVAAAEEEDADNNTTSVISFVRTFVVTFFTSLLPETPAL